MDDESSLNVVKKAEVAVGDFVDLNHIYFVLMEMHSCTHKSSREGGVSADFAVNFDQSLHENHGHFSLGKSELQSVSQQDDQRERFTKFVRAR